MRAAVCLAMLAVVGCSQPVTQRIVTVYDQTSTVASDRSTFVVTACRLAGDATTQQLRTMLQRGAKIISQQTKDTDVTREVRAKIDAAGFDPWNKPITCYGTQYVMEGPPAAFTLPPGAADARALIDRADELNADCRGGDADKVDAVCKQRDDAYKAAEAAGWCYGQDVQVQADSAWAPCK